ncbi:hypothetical protein BC829DRAFT_391407 [Chytridium lagenaria]|nr:hypothetical protein BC829DRAFT_391407 [Chytridium lagenaria]
MSNNVIEFQARQKKYVMSIWNFFMMSWDEDKTWEDAEFMVTFRPPEARENIDLAVKVMRLAERLITDSPMVNGILDEGVLERFNRFLSIETVVECSKAVAVAEAELKNVIDEMQENHAFHAMIRYKQILLEKAAVEEVLTELYEPEEVWAETEKLEELKNEERKLKEKMTEGLAAVEDLKKVKGRWEKMKERHAALSDVIKCRDVLEGKIRPLDPQLIVDTGVILHMELWMFQRL